MLEATRAHGLKESKPPHALRALPYKNTSEIGPEYVNQYVSTVKCVILGHIPTKCIANAVYRRIFDGVSIMSLPESGFVATYLPNILEKIFQTFDCESKKAAASSSWLFLGFFCWLFFLNTNNMEHQIPL